jgi:DNA helicase IV
MKFCFPFVLEKDYLSFKQKQDRISALKQAEKEREAERIKQERSRQESLRRQKEIKRNELFAEIRRWLDSDFLDVDEFYREFCSEFITQQEFEQEKIAFVKSWLAENTPNKNLPDDEQIAAIAAVHGHIQVIARAGSGKTTTLVNRTLFLLKHCGVDASEMLLLAFNRKAASEIRRRLLIFLNTDTEKELASEIRHRKNDNKKIDFSQIESNAVDAVAKKLNIKLPHVMTFHALASAIVHPEKIFYMTVQKTNHKL